MSPSRKRTAVKQLQKGFVVSERRACCVLDQPRSSQRYESSPRSDESALIKRMLEHSRKRPRFGYRRIARLLQNENWKASFTRVYRLWRREGLKVPRKQRKKRRLGTSANACYRMKSEHKDHIWCWDFVFDRTSNGSTLKWLSIVDEFTRECLTLKVGRGITSDDVINNLAELFVMRGVPKCIRSDNGPEFISKSIQQWLKQLSIDPLYIQPGSPWENGYAESFHSRFRDEFLRVEEFDNLLSAKKLTKEWKDDYNENRPHGSLGYLSPVEYARRCAASVSAPPPLQQHSEVT